MSKRLRNVIDEYLIRHGRLGKAQLCAAIDRTEKTLDRWLKYGVPTEHDAYRLAVACGLSEKEALAVARESSRSAKTA